MEEMEEMPRVSQKQFSIFARTFPTRLMLEVGKFLMLPFPSLPHPQQSKDKWRISSVRQQKRGKTAAANSWGI